MTGFVQEGNSKSAAEKCQTQMGIAAGLNGDLMRLARFRGLQFFLKFILLAGVRDRRRFCPFLL